jgi:hypothetical protein
MHPRASADRSELMTGVEGVSSRPVRRGVYFGQFVNLVKDFINVISGVALPPPGAGRGRTPEQAREP